MIQLTDSTQQALDRIATVPATSEQGQYRTNGSQHTVRTLVWPEVGDLNDVLQELRSRIEFLEADSIEQTRSQEFCIDFIVQRLEKLEAAKDQLSESPVKPLEEAENDRRFEAAKALIDKPAPAPAGSLVARVLSAMAHAPDGFGYEQEARAAIRVIAGELRAQCFVQAADWLDQCANPTSEENLDG